jgi:neutral ceramidase
MDLHRRDFLLTLAAAAAARPGAAAAPEWRAGVASADITPPPGVWMAGYAARKEAAQDAAQPLHAKALAVEDAGGRRAVIVTLDLLGLTAPVVDRIASTVYRRCGLARRRLLLCSSHTHSGPVVDDQLAVAYDLTLAHWDDIRASTRHIEEQVAGVVERALAARGPARLRAGQGSAPFAANRRLALNPDGPVDHAVPVLAVERLDGTLAAIVFGYACHNTTLPASFVRYHGDYAGVAQAALERRHPRTTALYIAGCGADANPSPRSTVELAEQHGHTLADAVDAALPAAAAVHGRLRTAFEVVPLAFAPATDADAWRRRLDDENVYVRRHARLMLRAIARDGHTRAAEDAPLHVVRIGTLSLVAIGGEVVVDYALAIKAKYGEATWVAGCTDSVFGYLPSTRVLREGGYEAGDAMLYYGRPGPFTETVETTVMSRVDTLMAATR